mmetsp:Transcript_8252/g.15312  ORF Transcript_8252/g.15312 Transcript_8252/m.15312 type:complete len:94 (+) Transcript_8252:1481-1762(+)
MKRPMWWQFSWKTIKGDVVHKYPKSQSTSAKHDCRLYFTTEVASGERPSVAAKRRRLFGSRKNITENVITPWAHIAYFNNEPATQSFTFGNLL